MGVMNKRVKLGSGVKPGSVVKSGGAVKPGSVKLGSVVKPLLMVILGIIVLFPVLFTFANSFFVVELGEELGEQNFAPAGHFSLMAYYKVFLATPNYLLKFWKSIGLCSVIAAGQLAVGCLAGMAFAKYRFRGKQVWFALMVLFMLLPVQAALVPNYLILSRLGLLGSYWALILPAVFSPFSTFLMTLVFQGVPMELLEAARLDGAGTLRTLVSVLVPAAKPGVACLVVLVFVDNWNMVEQPMVFLDSVQQFPLSVFLASMSGYNYSLQYVCGVLCLIPVTLLFLFFNEELSEGIVVTAMK